MARARLREPMAAVCASVVRLPHALESKTNSAAESESGPLNISAYANRGMSSDPGPMLS